MARPTLEQDQKTFLARVRRAKKSLGNLSLRSELGWSENRYWKVHSALAENGRIVRGRGRGGSVAAA